MASWSTPGTLAAALAGGGLITVAIVLYWAATAAVKAAARAARRLASRFRPSFDRHAAEAIEVATGPHADDFTAWEAEYQRAQGRRR